MFWATMSTVAGGGRTAAGAAGSPTGPADGAGFGGRLLGEPRVEVGAGQRVDVEQHLAWPVPHSSAHWPRNVWPASLSSTVNSNWLSWPGTTSRLNRNCGT